MNLPVYRRLSRRVRISLLAILALLSFLATLALLLSSTVLAAPPPPFNPPRSIPNTDVSPYGANFFLEREVEAWKRDKTLTMARDAGIAWARQQFPWEEIEPNPGEYNWSKYDDVVALYRKYGLQVIARLDRPPLWARANPSGSGASGPPDDFDVFGDFVEAFVHHYKGQINYIQVWNEPNLGREWNDMPIDPSGYVQLLKTAYTHAKAADSGIQVLSAPLAITLGEPYPSGGNLSRNMDDLQFLREMYRAGAKDYFDILSANAFGLRSPPDDAPDPGKLNFQRVELAHRIMVENGDAGKSVWINEYGWNASPDTMAESKLFWGRVTEEQQADYTMRGIDYARKNWPWVGVMCLWYFRQVGDISINNSEYYFRLVDPDFAPRPVYLQLKDKAAAAPVADPGQYEESNLSIVYSGNWKPAFNAQAGAGQFRTTQDEKARARVTFWGDAVSLVVHAAPSQGQFVVKLDGRNVDWLQHDTTGNSTVALSSEQDQWRATIPIASGLSRGRHTLELAPVGPANLDGIIIPPVSPLSPPWPLIALLLLLFGTSVLVLVREIRAPRPPSEPRVQDDAALP